MKRLSPSSPPHSAGISVTDFTLHKDIGLLLSFTAKLLEIRWPTLSAPLRIRLHGAHMVLENTSITKVGLLYCGPSSQAAGGHLYQEWVQGLQGSEGPHLQWPVQWRHAWQRQ